MKKMIKKNLVFLIPIVFFLTGVTYARNLEGFVGIGIAIMTIVGTLALILGSATYRLTKKIILSVMVGCGVFAFLLILVIILARSGF